MTYPKWCKVIVRRLLPNGIIVDFPAVEYWRENYATAGKDSEAPNAMWKKRPYGQIAKCAEAQALRKAFPEIGSQPTAEEMEGKEFSAQAEQTPAQQAEVILPPYPPEVLAENKPTWQQSADHSGRFNAENLINKIQSRYSLTDAQKQEIRAITPRPVEYKDDDEEDGHADFVAAMEGAE